MVFNQILKRVPVFDTSCIKTVIELDREKNKLALKTEFLIDYHLILIISTLFGIFHPLYMYTNANVLLTGVPR